MTLCQVQFYSGWVNLNLECQVVERFGTNEETNGQGNTGVGMSIANLLEDENVLNTKGLFKLKQIFINSGEVNCGFKVHNSLWCCFSFDFDFF